MIFRVSFSKPLREEKVARKGWHVCRALSAHQMKKAECISEGNFRWYFWANSHEGGRNAPPALHLVCQGGATTDPPSMSFRAASHTVAPYKKSTRTIEKTKNLASLSPKPPRAKQPSMDSAEPRLPEPSSWQFIKLLDAGPKGVRGSLGCFFFKCASRRVWGVPSVLQVLSPQFTPSPKP